MSLPSLGWNRFELVGGIRCESVLEFESIDPTDGPLPTVEGGNLRLQDEDALPIDFVIRGVWNDTQ
jgi:hypothetical protein